MSLPSFFYDLRFTIYDLLTRLNDRRQPLIKVKVIFPVLFLALLFVSFFFSTHSKAWDISSYMAATADIGQEAWLKNANDSATGWAFVSLIGEPSKDLLAGKPGIWIPAGVTGHTNQLIASTLTNRPASGIQYLASTWNSFLGKPAYAQGQGIGFVGLTPLLPAWRTFRNIIYVLSSIIFIAMGIMIILRVKISPQAVITIQTAIPSLITTLILVTFSYAIAGLVIDFSYFIQVAVAAALFPDLVNNPLRNLLTYIPVLKDLPLNIGSFGNPTLTTTIGLLNLPVIMTIALGTIIGGTIGYMLGSFGGVIPLSGALSAVGLGSIGGIIVTLVVTIAMIFWLLSFFFSLFKCYATIIFKIIIAPLEIGMGAFPGSKMGFNSWLMDLIAHIMVFPISIIFLLLSNKIILEIIGGSLSDLVIDIVKGNFNADSGLWAPSMFGGNNANSMAVCALGLSTLLLLSKLPDLIIQAMFMLKPSAWETAIGQGLQVENIPVVGGVYQNTKAAYGKAQGEATLAAIQAGLTRLGLGQKSAQNRENTGSGTKQL